MITTETEMVWLCLRSLCRQIRGRYMAEGIDCLLLIIGDSYNTFMI